MRTGRQVAKVVRHEFSATTKGSSYLNVTLDIGGEYIGGPIWFTEKAMGMSRATLKLMGFDVDREELILLDTNPTHLAGRTILVDVEEEEYNGRTALKARYVLDSVDKSKISKIQSQLRGAKHLDAPPPAAAPEADEIPF